MCNSQRQCKRLQHHLPQGSPKEPQRATCTNLPALGRLREEDMSNDWHPLGSRGRKSIMLYQKQKRKLVRK